MQNLKVNDKGELISIKLKIFCQDKEINIKYMVLYMYKKNKMVK